MEGDTIKQFRNITWILILLCGTFISISFESNEVIIYKGAEHELNALNKLNYNSFVRTVEEGNHLVNYNGAVELDSAYILVLNNSLSASNTVGQKNIFIENNGLNYPIKFNLPSANSTFKEIHSFLTKPQEIVFYYPGPLQKITNSLIDFNSDKLSSVTMNDTLFISSKDLDGQINNWGIKGENFIERQIPSPIEEYTNSNIEYYELFHQNLSFRSLVSQNLGQGSIGLQTYGLIYGNGNPRSRVLPYCLQIWHEISDLKQNEALYYVENKLAFGQANIKILGFELPREPISIFFIIIFFIIQFYILSCINELKITLKEQSIKLKGYICLPLMENAIGTILTFLLFLVVPICTLAFWNLQMKGSQDVISYLIIIVYSFLCLVTYIRLVSVRQMIYNS